MLRVHIRLALTTDRDANVNDRPCGRRLVLCSAC